MPLIDLVRSALSYHDALNRRMWDSIMTLKDEQFLAPIPYSHGSIRNQVVHLTAVDGRWLRGLQGQPDARTYNLLPDDYPTKQAAYDLWEISSNQLSAYTTDIDENELERYPAGMPGPVWQVLLHVVNHGTDHRAQILRALHDFDAPTFDQDLILHLWSF
jgi:uncharacterized damage-inducible protein DinB